MLKALSGAGPSEQLACIEDMRITIPETENTTERAAVLVAFGALATACKNTQVCGMLFVKATIAHVASPALCQKMSQNDIITSTCRLHYNP